MSGLDGFAGFIASHVEECCACKAIIYFRDMLFFCYDPAFRSYNILCGSNLLPEFVQIGALAGGHRTIGPTHKSLKLSNN